MTKSLAAHYFQLAADQGIPKIWWETATSSCDQVRA
jgi:hypothetical protein